MYTEDKDNGTELLDINQTQSNNGSTTDIKPSDVNDFVIRDSDVSNKDDLLSETNES